MHILKCPHCDLSASTFLKAYFWGYFPGNQPNRCKSCSKPVKYNINSYLKCGAIFLILLAVFGKLLGPIFSFFEQQSDPNVIVEKVPAFDILGITGTLLEIAFVFIILYVSFELPARFIGTRVFKKR